MAVAVFEVKSIVQNWGPPFGRSEANQEVSVEEGRSFDSHPKEGPIFKLIRCESTRALVEFSEKFTLKGHEHPRNRQVWIGMEEPVSFTYLWGNDGMTKSLLFKGIGMGKKPESKEEKDMEEMEEALEEEKPEEAGEESEDSQEEIEEFEEEKENEF